MLIWGVLVLALLGMLAAFGWWLFQKGMTAFRALGELSGRLELLDAASDEVSPTHFRPSILRDLDEVRDAHRTLALARADTKRIRRERRLARGKLLVTADVRKRIWPWDSSATHSDGRT